MFEERGREEEEEEEEEEVHTALQRTLTYPRTDSHNHDTHILKS